jgi:transcriptional regulator with XRE-family HTH domain
MESRLPEILRGFRHKRGLSQKQLAEMLYTVQSYISKIETGDRQSKAADIDFLWLVSERLSIPPEELGLSSGKPEPLNNSVRRDVLEGWESIVELADTVRSRGDPEAAIKHLSPIVLALEYQPAATELRVRAKLVFGIALGDRLPPDKLGKAICHLKEANDCLTSEHRDLKVQVLRAYGNELRKSGQRELALASLRQAKELLPASAINGSLAIALARAEADVQNWSEFRKSIADARRALDKQGSSHPLFNKLVVREVNLRGLLAQGDSRGVAKELTTRVTEPLNLAAQWRVIHAVTVAEAHLFIGEFSQGSEAAQKALSSAHELSMPQQVKRLRDILYRYRKESGAVGDLLGIAGKTLSTLSRLSSQRDA